MEVCGSLEHIFEKPLPDNPTLLESLSSWKQIKSIRPVDESSFTELFGELHFKESSVHPPTEINQPREYCIDMPKFDISHEKNKYYHLSNQMNQYGDSDSFSSMNSESLSLCTEGLGFESSGDVEDLLGREMCEDGRGIREEKRTRNHCGESKRSRTSRGELPPPISCIGSSGKPWVCFQPYRQDGRFILKEIRIPTQEFLHACREDGRFKLRFFHSESDDEIFDDDDEEERVGENVEVTRNGHVQ